MKQLFSRIVRIILVVYVFFFAYEWWRPMPDEMAKPSPSYVVPDKDVRFYYDLSEKDKKGKPLRTAQVEDRIGSLTAGATRLLLLMNENVPLSGSSSPRTLLETKLDKDRHSLITLITDPKSTRYGGMRSETLDTLRTDGIQVIETDMARMPDSNLIYSSLWRPFFSWWGNSPGGGWLPDFIDPKGEKVPLRSWLAFYNVKSNNSHALIADAVVDTKGTKTSKVVELVTSSDLADMTASSSNVALEVDDRLGGDLLGKAMTVASLSSSGLPNYNLGDVTEDTGNITVTNLDTAHMHEKVVGLIQALRAHDQLDITTRYLSDRDVIGELKDAAGRSVDIRIILDPNDKSYAEELYGLPNRPVAKELTQGLVDGIMVRWCDPTLVPCNARLMIGRSATSTFVLSGSADLTSRDLGGFNIESEVLAQATGSFTAYQGAEGYFNKLWNNDGGNYTLDYTKFQDDSVWRSSLYRVMELTGLSFY